MAELRIHGDWWRPCHPRPSSGAKRSPSRLRVGAERFAFNVLSRVPSSVRCALLGMVSGTRGNNVVYFNEKEFKKIALTIDDAPSRSPGRFEQLLESLKVMDARVTFQVISRHANTNEHVALLRRALAEGHQLTNHSTVDEKCTGLTAQEFESRLDECQAFLDELAPGARRWFRPPHGLMNAHMRSICVRKGYTVCLCDCYSGDPIINDVDYHVETLLRGASGGSMIILHCPEDNGRKQTLEVLPRLVATLRERGFQLVTLDELFPCYPSCVEKRVE